MLIVCEVALSLVLLMAAGVMLRSLLALRHVDAGFDPRNVLTMSVSLAGDAVQDGGADQRILRPRRCERIRALPGVRVPRARSTICRSQGGSVQPIVLEGHAELLPRDQPTVAVRKIHAGLPADDEDSAGARPRRRRRGRRRDARQPCGREAAVGRRRSDRPARRAAARVEDRR